MRTKGFFKIISVILAMSLMLSALPINFLHFLTAGESLALEDKAYDGMLTDANGNITNLDDATYTVTTKDGKTAYIWLSSNDDVEFGRAYTYDVYCDSTSEFKFYTESLATLAFVEGGEVNCSNIEETQFPIADTVFDEVGKMNRITFKVKGDSQNSSTAKLVVIVKDSSIELAGRTFVAFQYGDGNLTKVQFPLTGIDMAKASDIKFTNANANNVIQYTDADSLKVGIDVSAMNGPYEMYVYDGDITGAKIQKGLSEIPYYSQLNYPNSAFGSSNVAKSGCGPTAIAMAASYLLDDPSITPDYIASKYGSYYVSGSGSAWTIFNATAKKEGIPLVTEGANKDYHYFGWEKAYKALQNGQLVISLQTEGLFTSGGHFILLTGLTEDGKVLVNDPNGANYNKSSLKDGFENGFTTKQITQNGTCFWIYEKKDVQNISTTPFDEVYAIVKEHAETNNIKELAKLNFETSVYNLDKNTLRTDTSNTYSILLKDKYGHATIAKFETERESVKVTLRLVTKDASGNPTVITTDANGNPISNSIEYIFIPKSGESAILSKEIPSIYGYIFQSASAGDVVNNTLTKNVMSDITIDLEYEAMKPSANVVVTTPHSTVSPENDLNKVTNSNKLQYVFEDIVNNGNTDFSNAEITISLPVEDGKGTTLGLSDIEFKTGTFANMADGATLSVYEVVNGQEIIVKDKVAVTTSETLKISASATSIVIRFSENAFKKGANVGNKPELTATLKYAGFEPEFNIELTTAFNAKYKDTLNVEQPVSAEATVISKVSNPVHTLTIKYVDLATGETIKESIVEKYQAYDKINATLKAPKIAKYVIDEDAIQNLDKLESYVADTGVAYMPTSDVEIVFGYYAIKPYLAETIASAQYDSVYENDKQTFTFNGLGAYLNPTTQEGNAAMYGYNMLFSVPQNFSVQKLYLPIFDGEEVTAKIFYRYVGASAWTEYKTDANGQKVDISSLNRNEILVSSMYTRGAGALEIKVVYGTAGIILPKTFRAQDVAYLEGVINSDEFNEAKIALTTSTTYFLEGEEKEFSKKCEAKSNVYQPAVSDVNASANLSTLKGELYTYRFNNVKNDGTSALKDFTFKYNIPENTYLSKINIGAVTGGNEKYTITIKGENGEVIATYQGDANVAFLVENDDALIANGVHKSIEIAFGDVTADFVCNEGIALTFHTTWNDEDTSKTVKGNGTISAVWTSEHNAENSNEILTTFNTTTKVSQFVPLTSNPTVSSNVALSGQTIELTTDAFKNESGIEIFNFNALYHSTDNSAITSATTGAYENTTKYTAAKLIVTAYDIEGNPTEIYNDVLPLSNITLTVPEKTVALKYTIPVLPSNTKIAVPSVLSFVMKGEATATLEEKIDYAVGTIELDKHDLTIEETTNIGNKVEITTENKIDVANPSVVTPSFFVDGTGYFLDTYKHIVSGVKNDGNTNLYQTALIFTASEYDIYKTVFVGEWKSNISGYIGYTTTTSLSEAENGNNPIIKLKDFADVTTLDAVDLPTVENDKIVAVCIVINVLTPDNELITPAYCTSTLSNNVKPNETVTSGLTFGTHYGIVKDGNNITSEEAKTLKEVGKKDYESFFTVTKPAVSYPIASVSADTIPYRAQFTYTVSNIKNTGNTELTDFEIVNALSPSVRFISMKTPTFNQLVTYSVHYRVSSNNDWVLLQEGINGRESIEILAPELGKGEYITDIKFELDGTIEKGFESVSDWTLNCINWSDAYSIDDVIYNVEVNGHHGEVVANGRFSVAYTPQIPSILQSGFEVSHPEKIFPGQTIELKYSNIKNVTEATITKFALTQKLNENYSVVGLHTGSYEAGFSADKIKVLYRTNLSKEFEWFMLTDEVDIGTNTYLEFPTLMENEYMTDIALHFGDTTEGFAEIESPIIIIKPNETLENESTYTLEASLAGVLDQKAFGELVTLEMATEYGFVNVTANDEKGNLVGTYKVYGNVGEEFVLSEVTLKGYKTVSADGDTSGTFVLNESGNVTFVCKQVPKTGVDIVTSWNFIAGATLLLAVGIVSLIPERKKKEQR